MLKKYFISIFILINSYFSYSQDKHISVFNEDSLKKLGNIILSTNKDFIKYNANSLFTKILDDYLKKDNSFDYPFDSLKMISRIEAPDKSFRIFNWHILKEDNTFEYFGIIQSFNSKKNKYETYILTDKSEELENAETKVLDINNWYGAHYYKIILTKSTGKKYYTILGWDGNNELIQKKIIDVIILKSNGKPVFGAGIFKYEKRKNLKRIIFEYSKNVTMSLKYEKQYTSKGKDKANLIVFDRLVPIDPMLQDVYQFYSPSSTNYDAFIFKSGKWTYIKDVDARNKAKKDKKGEKKHDETPTLKREFYTPKTKKED